MRSHTVLFVTDVHFAEHHPGAWGAFKSFVADVEPALVVFGGDLVDLAALSAYTKSASDPVSVERDLATAVTEVNKIAERCPVTVMEGNHEDRWQRIVVGEKAQALRGTVGLSFQEQMTFHGLGDGTKHPVSWAKEDRSSYGLILGDRALLLRHGHKQGRFSPIHVGHKLLTECPTISTAVGHHHRAQLYCHTSLGETVVAVANPHMSLTQDYTGGNPNWQLGFTAFEFYGARSLETCKKFTAHLVVMAPDGSFAYGGKEYSV